MQGERKHEAVFCSAQRPLLASSQFDVLAFYLRQGVTKFTLTWKLNIACQTQRLRPGLSFKLYFMHTIKSTSGPQIEGRCIKVLPIRSNSNPMCQAVA